MPRELKTKNFTSLWTVVESMQRKLEGEGLDAAVVDAAVTRGLEALLSGSAHRPRRGSLAPAALFPSLAVAKA